MSVTEYQPAESLTFNYDLITIQLDERTHSKVSRYLTWMTVFYNSLWESVAPMVMVIFALLMMVVFFSSIMFIVEKGNESWNEQAGGYIDPSTGHMTQVGDREIRFLSIYPSLILSLSLSLSLSLYHLPLLAVRKYTCCHVVVHGNDDNHWVW